MPAFIKAEGCLVNARDVQEIHYSGNWGGIIGVKTAVPTSTDVGRVIARLVPEEKLNARDSMSRSVDSEKTDEATAAKVAESFAGHLMGYAKATDDFLIAFNPDTQSWDATRLE